MGRSTLLLMLAAILGGSYLSLTVLRTQSETQGRRSDAQASVLARQLAESGQAIALSMITHADGFANGGVFTSDRDYQGGTIRFEDYDDTLPASAPDNQRVAIQVAGAFGGATHRLHSVYEFDPMDFPGPLWLDVPHAAGTIHPSATVSGGAYSYEPQIDPTKHNDLDIADFGLSFAGLKSDLAAAGAPVPAWNASGKTRTGDLGPGVDSADDLYYEARNAIDTGAGDVVHTGNTIVSGSQTWGAPDAVTQVVGDLTVLGALSGEGALLVEGDLSVTGSFDWDGLVIVRTTEDHVEIDLAGTATIDGALVVSQEAFPPGGHIDLTVFRQPNGSWSTPYGTYTAGPGSLSARPAPWGVANPWPFWNHLHRFDHPAAGDADFTARSNGIVRLVDAPAGDPQEGYVGLRELLDHLGSQNVQIEIANPEAHGHSILEVEVDGEAPLQRSLSHGFADTDLSGSQTFRSKVFPAEDLERLVIRPQSLRSFEQMWDQVSTCHLLPAEWPICVGNDRNDREGALTVRIRKNNGGAIVWEGAVYWHMQSGDEWTQYQADLLAWQTAVTTGTSPFGTDLNLGPNATITYSLPAVVALAEKLGFDGNEVFQVSTSSDSDNANAFSRAATGADTTAADGGTPPPTMSDPDPDGDGFVTVCHKPGTPAEDTRSVGVVSFLVHIGHGDTLGPCP